MVDQRPTKDDRSSLAAVGRVLAVVGGASFELQPVLDEIAAEARAICRADVCFCFLRDGDVFRFAASSGGSPEHWAHDGSHPETVSRDSIVGRVALAGRVVQIPDVAADPDYRSSALSVGGYHTLMGVPIRTNEGMNGVLGVGRTAVETFSDDVIALVTVFADQAGIAMRLAGLLGTIDRQRTELARYAPQAAELLSSAEGEQLLAGHRREISALFADLRGFTAFAEQAEPEEVFGVLRQYHTTVGGLAVSNGGTVEHFAGDGLMVFFNDPQIVPNHQLAAVRTAVAMRQRFANLYGEWHKRGYELGLGIGIAAGYATLGRIGFEGRYDYGAVGNAVILASRLSDAAAAGQILVSQRVFAAIEGMVDAEAVEGLELKGLSHALTAYAVSSLRRHRMPSGSRPGSRRAARGSAPGSPPARA